MSIIYRVGLYHLFGLSVDKLFPLFFANLEDSILSVRQGAAAALTSVTKAYGETLYMYRL